MGGAALLLAMWLAPSVARGDGLPLLPPPPPPPASEPSSPAPQPVPPPDRAAEATPGAPTPVPPAPPPYVYEPAPAPVRAPANAFWVGGRLGLLGYGGAFFINNQNREETTGNLVGSGASLEVNLGARLNRRYIPYLLAEFAALRPGRRFDDDVQTSSTLLGLGFRFVIGNVDRAAFLADLSLAQRTVRVKRGSDEFRMHAPELFRLGLGAEIRISRLFTLSPMGHLSGGSMARSDGDIPYAPQSDGSTRPTFLDANISRSARTYLVVGIGCGAHFDLFGK